MVNQFKVKCGQIILELELMAEMVGIMIMKVLGFSFQASPDILCSCILSLEVHSDFSSLWSDFRLRK